MFYDTRLSLFHQIDGVMYEADVAPCTVSGNDNSGFGESVQHIFSGLEPGIQVSVAVGADTGAGHGSDHASAEEDFPLGEIDHDVIPGMARPGKEQLDVFPLDVERESFVDLEDVIRRLEIQIFIGIVIPLLFGILIM